MQMITRFDSEAELNAFLEHVGEVRKADNQPLRRGNLEKHVANLLGVYDWNTALGMVRKKEAVEPAKCDGCRKPLMPNGFCPDLACFHHTWPQAAEKGSDTVHRRLTVPARFASDDGRFETMFDATPYFQELIASHHNIAIGIIEEILKQGGSGCYETDDVARSFSDNPALKGYRDLPGYAIIVAAFSYFDVSDKDDTGFEVYIDTADLANWLANEHPDIFDVLSGEALNRSYR